MVGLMVNSVFAEEKSELMATLLHAVESQEDELQAELTGTYANWLRTTLNTSSQVFVSVKTLPIEASPGCKKLFATLFLPDLHWQLEGATQYFQFYFKLNLCRDGSAPSPP
ncbi:MAG: hypothetical protein QM520_00290 [Gammaproteobacteria bacterium]|nr:hypothetical protein [Gammaproteobacteria bacterium]